MRPIVLSLVTFLLVRPASAAAPLPEGDQGIAAKHPDDAGIDGDPAVIFADDFESYANASELSTRWDSNVYQLDQIRMATEAQNVFAGEQALEFTVPQQEAELSNAVERIVSPELDVLYLRYYSKFGGPFDVVGSSHNGSTISSHYAMNGQATPGVPADGTNKFLVAHENWRGEPESPSPGLLNVYVYHPEQRSNYGDHFWPDGTITPYDPDPPVDYFGPDFIPRPNIFPDLDTWHCYEVMVQANTPGQRDGRIAFWYDGALAADFQNLRLRDVPSLTIDRFSLAFHIGSNPTGEQHKWYDNVVAARSYIGPLYQGGGGDDTGATGSDSGDWTTSAGTDSPTGGGATSDAESTSPTSSATGTTSSTSTSAGTSESGPPQGGADGEGCACAAKAPLRDRGLALVSLVLLATARRRQTRGRQRRSP